MTAESLKIGASYRPMLIQENIDYLKTQDSFTSSKYVKILESKVHNNEHTLGLIPENSPIRDDNLETKYSIDTTFLLEFLEFADTFICKELNDFKTKNERENLFHFLSFYNYDFHKEYQRIDEDLNYKRKERKYNEFNLIIQFALDFKGSKNLVLPDLYKNIKNYTTILNKIVNYKFFITGLLKEALIYSLFESFIIKGYLDSRSRIYLLGYFLNLQNFPITKSFIKLFDSTETKDKEKHFEQFRQIISKNYNFSMPPTYPEYVLAQKEIENQQIKDMLKSNSITDKEFLTFLESPKNLQETFAYFGSKIKSLKERYLVVSSIMHLANQSDVKLKNMLGVDARNSGLQMTAILLRNKKTAKYACLTGNQPYDLYLKSSQLLHSLIVNALNCLYKVENLLNDFSHPSTNRIIFRLTKMESIKNIKQLGPLLEIFFSLNYRKITNRIEFFKLIIPTLIELNPELRRNILKSDWLLSTATMVEIDDILLYHPDFKHEDLRIIFTLKEIFHLNDCMEKYNISTNIFKSRNNNKNSIMAYGYGAKYTSRKEKMEKTLLEAIPELDKRSLNVLVNVFERFFPIIIEKFLFSSEELILMSKDISEKGKFVEIRNPFFTIIEKPIKMVSKIIRTTRYYSKLENKTISRKLHVNQPQSLSELIIDQKGLRNRFGPNFIHSMDAFVVHLLRLLIKNMNTELERKLGKDSINIFLSTNHDHFILSQPILLKPLLMLCYKKLYQIDYLSSLKNTLDPELYKSIALRASKARLKDEEYLEIKD